MPRAERPIDAVETELGTFAADLRRLREKAGKPAYRELASRAHYSAATLADAASGRKLPTLAVTLAYVSACGGDTGEWEKRWRLIASPPDVTDDAPYVGLTAFQPQDADRFFGREKLTRKLEELVAAEPFVGVFGPSGSGKSSLLRAGLVPRLGNAVLFTPGALPADECAVRLAQLTGESAVTLRAELAEPAALGLLAKQHDIVLVVDQFEEVFTLCDTTQRDWFIAALTNAPRVVVGVRADFYGHVCRHPELVEALDGAQLQVGPLTADELRRAITEPAHRVGAAVETALVTRLMADVAGQAAALPMIQHALVETWHRRRGMTLTLAGYVEAGGVEHAIAHTAEVVFSDLSAEQQTTAKQIFLRLIALGEGTEDTKRRANRADLDDDVLDRLAAARLVSLSENYVELSHEALIRSWPRLRNWIADDREMLRVHHQLTEATTTWEALGRDKDALYRGARLAEVRSLPLDSLTRLEREFVAGSAGLEAAWHAASRRRARRTRVLLSVLTVLVVVLAGTVVYAVDTAREVTRQRNAVLARRASEEVSANIASDPRLAARLALAADALGDGEASRDAVLTAGAARHKVPLAHAASRLPFFRISKGGRFFVAEHAPGVRVVDNMTAAEVSLPSLKDATLVSFSGDDQRLFVVPQAGGTEVWDLANSAQLGVLPRHLRIGTTSRTGEIVAGMDFERAEAEVWSLKDPRHPRALGVPGGRVGGMSVRSDGSVLAVLRTGAVALELWQLDGDQPRLLGTSEQPDAHWAVLEMSPDGKFVALWNRSAKHVVIWDISDPAAPSKWATLPETSDNQVLISFSAAGPLVAVAVDANVQVWNIGRRDAPTRLATFAGFVGQTAAVGHRQADNTFVAVDRNATVWPLRTDLEAVRADLCAEAETLSADEWARHFGVVKQVPICEQQAS